MEDLYTWFLMGQPKGFPTGTAYVTGQSLESTEEARIKTPFQAHSAGLRIEAYCVHLTTCRVRKHAGRLFNWGAVGLGVIL